MRSFAGVFIGKLIFVLICFTFMGPVCLVVGYMAWRDGAEFTFVGPAIGIGLAITVPIPFVALKAAREDFPGITLRNRLADGAETYDDDTFVMLVPRSSAATDGARVARADVVKATLVSYDPDNEATFTTYGGNYAPAEFTARVRLTLRVHETDGVAGFETTDDRLVPSLCLAAVTAGRLVVNVDPADPGKAMVRWPRSLMLSGVRAFKVIGLDGQRTELTGRPDLLLEGMRGTGPAGGIPMTADAIDLRRLDAETAARYGALAERARALPADRAPITEPGEEARWIVDELPGEKGEFGRVSRRWVRRGGHLARGRFLELRGTCTFQTHGPVLDTVLRVEPTHGSPPFLAERRLTLPMNYLAVLHRTHEIVLQVAPNGRSFVIDWARTNLLAGVTPAKVISLDGEEHSLTNRPDLIWPLMTLLATHAVSIPGPTLDLRTRPAGPLANEATALLRGPTAANTPHL
ncbi:hypothetical protein ACFVT5_11255 [Streptomyces sp. NPDC058001]|uniref:hypothetical protein n=1 Tax=Streptomyces sp. NPDC058001 TaxID=3346300 RepID=UPI0036E8D40D